MSNKLVVPGLTLPASADRIAASLIATMETNMGLGANTEDNLKIAKKIVNAKRSIIVKDKQ
ncbi:MAG: hypothetical protein JSU99_01665 [Nitrospiraceae bacterium]|nr:MAG: hypothetical protein JSU99_01665 [Nitrospiraceae bacterium]